LLAGTLLGAAVWSGLSARSTTPPPQVTRSIVAAETSVFYDVTLSPDGSWLAYTERDGKTAGTWSPDGTMLTFVEMGRTNRLEIWLLTLTPERRVRPLIQNPFNNQAPRISPDGRWLAYISDDTGRPEVYVQPFPALGPKWQISSDGGCCPNWDPHGGDLFYLNRDKVMAVAVRTHPTFSAAAPHVLFARSPGQLPYDVAADGRFVLIEPGPSDAPAPQITIVQNWFEELKHRVPTK
jgi:eukaryotic-like serine/threonine-protein kinase